MPGPEEQTKEAGEKGAQDAEPAPNTVPVAVSADSVKRPRGRSRKHPVPVISENVAPDPDAPPHEAHPEGVLGTVAVPSADSSVGSALLRHSVGPPDGAGTAPGAPAQSRRPRGRPRKHPLTGTQAIPAEPGGPPAASLGGTAMLTPAPESVAPVPLATTGHAAVIIKRPRGRPRKHPLPDAGGISGGVSVPSGQPGLVAEKRVAGILSAGTGTASSEGRPRGRKRKAEPSILNPFCPDCGTYLRMFRPPRGRWRKVCPRCEPERLIVKRDYRDYIDKTGMPCKDRGKCRPERCVKALECEEMGRYR